MKTFFPFIISAIFSLIYLNGKCQPVKKLVYQNFHMAAQQYKLMLDQIDGYDKYPQSVLPNGETKYSSIKGWTGGFWPGVLWYLYEYTGKKKWLHAAQNWTVSLERNQFNTSHHDIGFMMYCSYGNGYRLTKNKSYIPVLIQSAQSLITRYSPVVGSIQSWNAKRSKSGNYWDFPVIMDNMMNLELLCWASDQTGDSTYKQIAIRHATTTMKNHIRPDFSSYHVVSYDPKNGTVRFKQTAQGFSDSSTWARGQAWGIYGFTVMYRETKEKKFLNTATGMADYFIKHNRSDDKIPDWDFNVAGSNFVNGATSFNSTPKVIPKDASAAAIASSALLELGKYVDEQRAILYKKAAIEMISSLSSETYRSVPGKNNYFLLKHSVGNYPGGVEVDVPLIYADYYFLEALLRLKNAGYEM